MHKDSIYIQKIWEDLDFFELSINFSIENLSSTLNIYTSNDDLEILKQGLTDFSNNFKSKSFRWVSGEDNQLSTHYLSLNFTHLDNRGNIKVEVLTDTKENPHNIRTNFYIITDLNQIDDFINKIGNLKENKISDFKSLIQKTV